ncbi:hypothetical protein HO929_03505 [Streptococcus suis]|nr:hypothetical protein [Streptococcus suis]NQP29053.1 hypothetical protein [Streptococcus suis]
MTERSIIVTTTYEIFQIDGEEYIHCPVCGRNVMLFDVCECNWENTGETNIDGGPNKMTLEEAKKAYAEGRPII